MCSRAAPQIVLAWSRATSLQVHYGKPESRAVGKHKRCWTALKGWLLIIAICVSLVASIHAQAACLVNQCN
jgi:hypothetical protein